MWKTVSLASILSKQGQAWLGAGQLCGLCAADHPAAAPPCPAAWEDCEAEEWLHSEPPGFPGCHWQQGDTSFRLATDLARCHGRCWSLGPFCSSSIVLIFAKRFQ